MSGVVNATEAQAEKAIAVLKRAINAAENSNQAGENFVVAAAAGEDLLDALRRLVRDVRDLMADSAGVAGLHLNGDVADWGWLEHNGGWLESLGAAEDVIAKATGGAA